MKLKTTLVLVVALALGGCFDPETSREYQQPTFVKSTQECNGDSGFCFKCAWTHGEYKCGYGYNSTCPGEQPVTYKLTPWISRRQSGNIFHGEDKQLVSVDGVCK